MRQSDEGADTAVKAVSRPPDIYLVQKMSSDDETIKSNVGPCICSEWSSLVGSAGIVGVDLVDTDVVVGPAGVEVSARLGPGEGGAAEELLGGGLVLFLGGGNDVVLNELLLREVEHLDAGLGGNNEPVETLGEENGVDGGVAVVLSEPLALDDVPNHDLTVTGAGGKEGGVLDDIEGGDLSLVTLAGVEEGHVEVVPDLDGLIPGSGDAKSGLLGVVESDNGDGIGMLVVLDGVLALRAGVPDLDVSVEGASDDLSVVGGEGNGENVSLVTNELGDGGAGGDVPETNRAVPRGRESEARIASELDLRDEMRVTAHHLSGLAPLGITLLLTGRVESPLDEGSIAGTGKKEFLGLTVDFLLTDSEGGNPTAVA